MTRYPRQGKGRRWTVKELEAVPADWKGDTLSDGDGLVGEVRVSSEGAVSLTFRYGFKWEGKKAWHYCGTWPASSLEAIRAERDRARTLVKDGVKPTDAKRAAKIEAQAKVEATIAADAARKAEDLTNGDLIDAWLQDGVARKDGNRGLRLEFDKNVRPFIGAKPVRLTTEHDLRALLRAIVDRGANRLTVVVRNNLATMYHWAEKRQPWRRLLAEGNPVDLVDVEKIVAPDYDIRYARDRVLSDKELRELRDKFRSMETAYAETPAGSKYGVARPLKKENQLALWICLGTMCRIGELLQARWEHVNLDTGEWMVPAENTKTGVKWQVFLSEFALRQFQALHRLTGATPFCFPARAPKGQTPAMHVDLASVSKQVGDRQERFKKRRQPLARRSNDDTLVLDQGKSGEWTPHDLRRTGATMMEALGVPPTIIDKCQNHVMAGSQVRRHYLHYPYAAEKRDAWERLGRKIDSILGSGRVIELAARRA